MEFSSIRSMGALYGLIMGLIVFGFSFWGIHFSLGSDDKVLKLMLLVPAYIFAFVYAMWVISAFMIKYRIDENGLKIIAGIRKLYIPFDQISEIIRVKGKSNIFSIIGVKWPGTRLGLFTVRGIGPMRFYATKTNEGFIYIKSKQGYIGITPNDYGNFMKLVSQKFGEEVQVMDMDVLAQDVKGTSAREDSFYRLMMRINIVFLLAFGAYLALFFPGSGAPNFIILLMVLALALFFFNIGNAERLFQFSSMGGYILLAVGIMVTGIFFILSLSEIHL